MLWALAVALAVAALAVLAWWWLFRARLPMVNGTIRLEGIRSTVEILRDEWGIPHVYARTIEDACFAQGVVHAQDRLWQLELNRRVGSGRLAELFGELALPADRFLRRIGLRRAAEDESVHLAPEERRLLTAYAAGVNAAVTSGIAKRPLEFTLLGLRFEPWTIVDSLAWAKVMALNLSANMDGELFRARLVAKVGPERAAFFELHDPTELNVVVPPGAKAGDPAADLAKMWEAARPFLDTGFAAASNNWVVAGARTASGKPMLANDPHLTLAIPSIWYETHLVVEDSGNGRPVDAFGVSLPAAPGIVLGHNRDVAWGFTNSFADAQDLYLERFDAKDPLSYEFQGTLERARIVEERISVKGTPDVIERVLITRHGPVLAEAKNGAPALALRWTAYEPGHMIQSVLGMNRARDAAELRDALRLWHTPSQNVVFADAKGNIGYVMAGAVPKRANGSGFLPAPGWTGEHEWTGMIPFEELPQAWNPECGFVVTANNAVVDHRESPHHVSWDYMNGYRAQRIEDLLLERGARKKLDARDFRDIQMDTWCRPGKRFAELVAARKIAAPDARAAKALEALTGWDGNASIESVGTTVYESMMLAVVRRAFEAEIGKDLVDELLAKAPHQLAPASMNLGRYVRLVLKSLERDDRRGFVESRKAAADPWRDVLAEALGDACAMLSTLFGHDDVSRWTWGTVHRLDLAHPLAAKKPLHLLFRGRNVPIGGDTDTPLQTAFVPAKPFQATAWAPSWRQIVDLADVRRTQSIFATGQSGHPASAHWLDQFESWYRGGYHPQHLDPEDVADHAVSRLRLLPSASSR